MTLALDTDLDEALAAGLMAATPLSSGCLVWRGAYSGGGYPTISVHGQKVYVHRYLVSRRDHRGYDEDTWVARHVCTTFGCVEEDHLIPGTKAENNADTARSGRVRNGSSYDTALPDRARAMKAEGLRLIDIALVLKVHPSTVWRWTRKIDSAVA